MVSRTQLPNAGLEVSRLSLGLSRVHRIRSRRDRMHLIGEARVLGVTHFDTARLYGDGIGERVLGTAIGRHRSSVTIATKFGLLPASWIGTLGTTAWPFWAARSVLRRMGAIAWPRRSYAASTMWCSLHASLRSLGTDYVDILFVHEPELTDLGGNDELFGALDEAKRAGKVRFVGVSGLGALSICMHCAGVFDVVQTAEAAWAGGSPIPDFTYGAISAVGGGGSAITSELARTAVAAALARRENGSVIVGTTDVEHLRAAVAVADASRQ